MFDLVYPVALTFRGKSTNFHVPVSQVHQVQAVCGLDDWCVELPL